MGKLTIRQKLAHWIARSGSTSISVGSFISSAGERSVAITLLDGYRESAARLSPEGARATARQLNEWANWADKGNHQHQWQILVRSVSSPEEAESVDAPVAQAE